jgi:hypothetical protein
VTNLDYNDDGGSNILTMNDDDGSDKNRNKNAVKIDIEDKSKHRVDARSSRFLVHLRNELMTVASDTSFSWCRQHCYGDCAE